MKKKIIIAEVLPGLLKERGITAKQLAKEAGGISASTISTWLLPGSRPRNIEDVAAVAEVLGVSMNHLLFGDAEEPQDLLTLPAEAILEGVYRLKLERIPIPKKQKK